MSTPFSDQELVTRIRWYTAVRWFFVLAIGVPGVVTLGLNTHTFFSRQVLLNISLIIGILLLNALSLFTTYVHVRIKGFYELMSVLQICFDVALMTAVFELNGGIETPIVMLYIIPILMSGVLLNKQAVYRTGFGATAIFVVLVLLDYFNLLKPDNIEAPPLHNVAAAFWPTAVVTTMTLIVMTFITNFVAYFVRQNSRLAGELEGTKIEQAKTEAIVNSMGSSLVAMNKQGRITLVNNAFERLMGWTDYEVIGQPARMVLQSFRDNGKPTHDVELALNKVLNHKAPQPVAISENLLRRKNGETFAYIGHLSPIMANERCIGATLVFDDASAIHEIGQLKSNFIALVSHQLKTPIGEIKNYSESLLGGTFGRLNKNQIRYLEHIKDTAAHCNQMVTYLLDMSLLERGEMQAHLRPTAVYGMLELMAELYAGRAREHDQKIKVTGNRQLTVLGDETMLREVIGSLISNSLSYTRNGVIELCATKVGKVGFIEVTDEGRGIDQEKIEQLFHRETALSGLPKAGGGTGLGLYLAHEFVRLQGGILTIHKNNEHGTIFRIQLPVK